ncbi:uncharacterized protein MELLADRAFT_69080 [Melampsora larici-populina 98AG31]|uniref:DUF4219 domain-containing protein n=1 Tax=Melampsora larici-populina (strain 98AG31 / pathotype 3-4-7) TaxID=747676 RepID=F4S9B8_MELLP|nr:uncharacterized protein MELLADRAFT_69080 [Melampsora larici-populina 98AG31]EGF98792.1 hypothetical protein MELLADRAFT_69080 [Melampsora larici-populina 98AG31]
MSSDTKIHIVKLNDDNYTEWKGDITGYLMSHGLQEFLVPNHTPVARAIAGEEKINFEAYVTRQNKAAGIMYSYLTEPFRIQIESEGLLLNPVGIWKHLKEKFQSTSANSQGRACRNFLRIPFVTLAQYIKDVRKGMSVMEACGCATTNPILEPLLCEGIIFKLPDSMETVVSLITAKQSESGKLSCKTVLTMLDAHLVDFTERHREDSSIALMTTTTAAPARYSYP